MSVTTVTPRKRHTPMSVLVARAKELAGVPTRTHHVECEDDAHFKRRRAEDDAHATRLRDEWEGIAEAQRADEETARQSWQETLMLMLFVSLFRGLYEPSDGGLHASGMLLPSLA